jgi:hypothetical protein
VLQVQQALQKGVLCLTKEGKEKRVEVLIKGLTTSLSFKLIKIDLIL